MVFQARCGHSHSNLYAAANCHDERGLWLYRRTSGVGDDLDLGRVRAMASHLTLRQSGTATGPDLDLAEDRRRSAERERGATLSREDGYACDARFALGLVAALVGAYLIARLRGNFVGGRG